MPTISTTNADSGYSHFKCPVRGVSIRRQEGGAGGGQRQCHRRTGGGLQPGSRALQYAPCDRDSCDTEDGAQ
jgi:hypothetical protein